MFNLYSFLYYTLSLSVLAVFLLLLKRIFRDKLSPRWQYGIWSLLALRAVLPLTGNGKELTSFIQWFVETLKQLVEPGLASAYTRLDRVTTALFPIPVVQRAPVSPTDWIFAGYVVGVIIFALYYLFSYIRLRKLLKNGVQTTDTVGNMIDSICKEYSLYSCDVLEINGISSAFICGVFKPVLIIPAGSVPERQVLLHELLHLRYYDAVQNLFWCLVKIINWCNPLLLWVCRRIGNDLESLCDQRVLERLEGEERRDYGRTLLAMANQRYARTPGTTSLSNGGPFIAQRIEAIARFKRYPRGMALVSVCMGIILAFAFFYGNQSTSALYRRPYDRPVRAAMSVASARIYRCTTPAGAFDTYAKGLFAQDRMILAAASPLEDQQEIIYGQQAPWISCEGLIHEEKYGYNIYNRYLQTYSANSQMNYRVYNLRRVDEHHEGLLVLQTGPFAAGDNTPSRYFFIVHPLRLLQQQGRWVVEPSGEPYFVETKSLHDPLQDLPPLASYQAKGEYGHAEIVFQTALTVNNERHANSWIQDIIYFDRTLKPNAEFESYLSNHLGTYHYTGSLENIELLGIATRKVYGKTAAMPESLLEEFAQRETEWTNVSGSSSGGDYDGISFDMKKAAEFKDWDRQILMGSGGGGTVEDGLTDPDKLPGVPAGIAIRLYLNDEPTEDLMAVEVVK